MIKRNFLKVAALALATFLATLTRAPKAAAHAAKCQRQRDAAKGAAAHLLDQCYLTGSLLAIDAPVITSGATAPGSRLAEEQSFFRQW